MREWLEWKKREFEEFDVETDAEALSRMLDLTDGQRTVPVLVEDGKATQIGWQGRGCVVGKA
jgi:glutaredoxin 3